MGMLRSALCASQPTALSIPLVCQRKDWSGVAAVVGVGSVFWVQLLIATHEFPKGLAGDALEDPCPTQALPRLQRRTIFYVENKPASVERAEQIPPQTP